MAFQLIDFSQITGQITTTQIAPGSITTPLLAANIIKAGIVDGTTINAAQYVADGASGEYLAYSAAPAFGNLVSSVSALAGTDQAGNAFLPGNTWYAGDSTNGWMASNISSQHTTYGSLAWFHAATEAGPWTYQASVYADSSGTLLLNGSQFSWQSTSPSNLSTLIAAGPLTIQSSNLAIQSTTNLGSVVISSTAPAPTQPALLVQGGVLIAAGVHQGGSLAVQGPIQSTDPGGNVYIATGQQVVQMAGVTINSTTLANVLHVNLDSTKTYRVRAVIALLANNGSNAAAAPVLGVSEGGNPLEAKALFHQSVNVTGFFSPGFPLTGIVENSIFDRHWFEVDGIVGGVPELTLSLAVSAAGGTYAGAGGYLAVSPIN